MSACSGALQQRSLGIRERADIPRRDVRVFDFARPISVTVTNCYSDRFALAISHSHAFTYALAKSHGEPVTFADSYGNTIAVAYA